MRAKGEGEEIYHMRRYEVKRMQGGTGEIAPIIQHHTIPIPYHTVPCPTLPHSTVSKPRPIH